MYNKEQMLEGKRRDGNDISPSYFEDPFFKTIEQATAYSNWKDEITPNPKRRKGVPNLFINGWFHSSIKIDVTGEAITFDATFKGPEIESKYKLIYGLNAEKRALYISFYLRPYFITGIKNELF